MEAWRTSSQEAIMLDTAANFAIAFTKFHLNGLISIFNNYCGVHVSYFNSEVYLHYKKNIEIF